MNASVIIVDDDESIRRALGRLLGARGYHTRHFGSGEECLEAVAADIGPACVVTDVILPGMDGLELQRALATRFPFVILTGHADVPKAVATMLAGAIDFLEKPIPEDRLFSAIDKGLELAQARHTDYQATTALQVKMERLTQREREVMALLATGLRNKQVAYMLGTVEKTIKVHRAHVMQKLELKSLAEMVRCADRLGVSVLPPQG